MSTALIIKLFGESNLFYCFLRPLTNIIMWLSYKWRCLLNAQEDILTTIWIKQQIFRTKFWQFYLPPTLKGQANRRNNNLDNCETIAILLLNTNNATLSRLLQIILRTPTETEGTLFKVISPVPVWWMNDFLETSREFMLWFLMVS